MILVMRHIRSHQVQKAKKAKDYKLVEKLMNDPNIIGNMMADKLADYKRFNNYEKSDKL